MNFHIPQNLIIMLIDRLQWLCLCAFVYVKTIFKLEIGRPVDSSCDI